MEKNIFFRMMMTIVIAFAVALTGCTDETFLDEQKTPTPDPEDPTVSAVLNHAGLFHAWEYSDGLVVDYKKCQANITLTEKGVTSTDDVNQVLPFEISWDKLERMVRSTPEFKLEEKSASEKYLSESKTNNNLGLSTYTQSFMFNFDGFSLTLSTRNQEVKYNKHSGINLPNCQLDSIVFVSQENEVLERFEVNGEPYLRTKVTLVFDVFRHHTDNNEQHVDRIYPNLVVDAPEDPNTGEDMFNGAIPINGTEKLFLKTKVDNNTSIYTSQRDVYEFWSVSGKKRVTYSVDLEIKQWIDDEQEAWKVPNIEFGNPKIAQTDNNSGAYAKDGNDDYEFEKTTSDWTYTWNYAYNYQIGTHASSEKAWKLFNGLRVMEMPSSKHLHNYDKYTYSDATDKDVDGKTYLSYPSVIYFKGSYNNDAYDLNQKQEFLVEKGNILPPAPVDPMVSETILYEFENNSKIISRIIWRRDYKETGTRDSVAVQEFIRETKIDEDNRFVRSNDYLGLKQAMDVVTLSERTNTDSETGHVITTNVIRYGFDFDFFTFNVEETYQTAYTMYNGKQLNFIAPVPQVAFSGAEKSDIGEVTEDGKKYNRTRYALKFKETYEEALNTLSANVDIDVEDTKAPEVDNIINWSFDRNRDKLASNIVLHIERNLSGKKDSVLIANFKHENSLTLRRHFYADNNELKMSQALDPIITKKVETIDGIEYTTTTTVRKFVYNLYVDEVTTVDQTAKINFQGTEIDFLAPEATSLTYAGSKPTDMGIVTGDDGTEYNRTNYLNTYKVTFDGATTDLTAEVDIDVKKANPKDEYVSHTVSKDFDPNTGISTITFHIVGTLSQRDSVATQNLAHQVIVDNDKRFVRTNNALIYQEMNSSSTETTRTENGNYITTVTTTNNFKFNVGNSAVKTIHETAYTLYRGERIDFISPASSVIFAGAGNPLDLGVVNENGKEYNRSQYTLTYQETYSNVQTPYSNKFNIDVEKSADPTIDQTIDLGKTRQFGRLSWAWDTNGQPFVSGTIITTTGVISFWNGGYNFHEMDVNTITDKLGNALCTESSDYLIPSYINIETKPNKHWVYTDVNGKTRDEVYGTLIEKLEDVTLDKPFFGEPNGDMYQITEGDGTVRVRVVYNGNVLFDEVLSK